MIRKKCDQDWMTELQAGEKTYRCDQRDGVDILNAAPGQIGHEGLLPGLVIWIHLGKAHGLSDSASFPTVTVHGKTTVTGCKGRSSTGLGQGWEVGVGIPGWKNGVKLPGSGNNNVAVT